MRKSLETTLEKIHESSLKFLSPLTPESTFETITQEAVNLVGAEFGSILLGVKGELQRVYASNPILYKILPRRRGLIYQVFKSRKPLILKARALAGVKERHPALREISTRAIILIPLSYRGESLGVLTVQAAKAKSFTAAELNTLKLFGSLASLAIRKTQLYAETREALQLRDSFFSIAAHELRTPLTTIYGYAQLLNGKLPRGSSELRWTKELMFELVRLTHLVNGLISVNKIRSNDLQYIWRHCSVCEILEKAIEAFRILHPDRVVVVKKELKDRKDVIVGDFEKMEQVVLSILDNAAKFSPSNEKIVVTIKVNKQDVVLLIRDKGRGIDKKDLHKVLEGFYKGANNFVEGMGMGLFLVKHLVTRHKGTIDIDSEKGKGTVVTITLPRIEE
ncbi:MAG: HAMP domain-containing sensor histidine kinase [bacterium]|nr:HAMP domain-containing sensor histidine kinase [bacterium]